MASAPDSRKPNRAKDVPPSGRCKFQQVRNNSGSPKCQKFSLDASITDVNIIEQSSRGKQSIVKDEGEEDAVIFQCDTHLESYDDMVSMKELSETTVLRNLKIRYLQDQIYTYINSILIAVNPYRNIEGMYDRFAIMRYNRRNVDEHLHKLNTLSPHIFAVANLAHQQRQDNMENQVMVISGESGSGKTESTKLILQYLAQVSGQHTWVEQQLIDSNPILEAFGNAKTGRNDNSSRFGKYIDVAFTNSGYIHSATISQYLLEKSRIVHQENSEQNYHVFYWMISGMSAQQCFKLKLSKHEHFKYLGRRLLASDSSDPSAAKEEAKDKEKEMWQNLENAFRILSFEDKHLNELYRLLSGILHLGQIEFRNQPLKNSDHVSTIRNPVSLAVVCDMLGMSNDIMLRAMTNRTLWAQNQTISTTIEAEQSSDVRDALAKGLYGRLFDWVVRTINNTIQKSSQVSSKPGVVTEVCDSPAGTKKKMSHIGVLDVFGFEDLSDTKGTCGFEQFCINYANEKLQQFFVQHVFQIEQDEYIREGVVWTHIDYSDNQVILDLIADTNMSLLALINEETIFPKSTDSSLCQKLQRVHAGRSSNFISHPYGNANVFGVRHFAGDVKYSTTRFLDKNRDSFSNDLLDLVYRSKNPFIQTLFEGINREETTGTWKKGRTLLSHFRRSLDQLMHTMGEAKPHFIRCIRPNVIKTAQYFDSSLVLKQLRYSGIMSTIEIRRLGYPIRYTFDVFLQTFFPPVENKNDTRFVRSIIEYVCTQAISNSVPDMYFIGRSIVYAKQNANLQLLEWKLGVLLPSIQLIQSTTRRWNQFRAFRSYRMTVILVQRVCRVYLNNFRKRIGKRSADSDRNDASALVDSIFKPILEDESVSENRQRNKAHDNDVVVGVPQLDRCQTASAVQYRFVKFARAYFSQGVSHKYSPRGKLSTSLLKLEDRYDVQAAIACWYMLQQLMHRGETASFVQLESANSIQNMNSCKQYCSDCKEAIIDGDEPNGFILDQIRSAFHGNKYSLLSNNCSSCRRKYTLGSLRKRSKIPPESRGQHQAKVDGSEQDLNDSYLDNPFMPRRKMSSLEQQHFIIGMGIVRESLRDEIYCQVMKQLTSNNVKKSYAKGWLLLAHLISTFVPSKVLFPYVEDFIRYGPGCLSEFCYHRLLRTKLNGNRTQPPSWLEMHATKMKRSYVNVGVTLMDGSTLNVQLDPASNSSEVVKALSKELGMTDNFGFSIFIAVLDKVSSLGSGPEFIMDAVSNCEQYCREKQGTSEKNAPWRLFFRKEIFAPWHDPSKDSVSTNLIYHQICRGIRYGEYKCPTRQALNSVLAKIFMIECGNFDSISTFAPTLLPEETGDVDGSIESLKPLIKDLIEQPQSPLKLKEELVHFAQTSWPMLFSRFFEASLDSRPDLPTILAINWVGLSIIADEAYCCSNEDSNGKSTIQLLHINYAQMLAVSANVNSPSKCVFIHTTKRPSEPFKIYSPETQTIRDLLVYFLNEIRSRSKYFVATADHPPHVKKGDLLQIPDRSSGEPKKGDDRSTNKKITVKSDNDSTVMTLISSNRNSMEVQIPTMLLHRLATINTPSEDVLNDFRSTGNAWIADYKLDCDKGEKLCMRTISPPSQFVNKVYDVATNDELKQSKSLPTLREYAKHKFNKCHSYTYQHSPITKALLKQISSATGSLEIKALHMFDLILHYSERDPVFENVESIIQIALSHPLLRDECFCQLLKQLNGSKGLVHNHLWQVMWLLTGCCCPYCPTLTNLIETCLRQSSEDATSLSLDCLHRLQKTIRRGSRKYPPIHIEYEAIQKGTTQIYHRICLPDGREEILEIESCSRAKDVCADVVKKLHITEYPVNHFAIYVNISGRMVIIPPTEFFFDFLRSIMSLITKAPNNVTYEAIFKRKLWMQVNPGSDVSCDVFIHFPQEKENFLEGYHNQIGLRTIISLSSLLHLIQCCKSDDFKKEVDLNECLPKPYLSGPWSKQKLKTIRDQIQSQSANAVAISSVEIDDVNLKIDFLRTLNAQSKIFGYTVFGISCPDHNESTMSSSMYLAVGEAGVYLLDPGLDNQLIAYYPYKQLTNWTSGSCYLHLTIGDLISGRKLLFETVLGYRIDDLLTSYVSVLIEQQLTGSGPSAPASNDDTVKSRTKPTAQRNCSIIDHY